MQLLRFVLTYLPEIQRGRVPEPPVNDRALIFLRQLTQPFELLLQEVSAYLMPSHLATSFEFGHIGLEPIFNRGSGNLGRVSPHNRGFGSSACSSQP